MINSAWKRIVNLRRIYIIAFLGYIPWILIVSHFTTNTVVLIAALLFYGLGLYLLFLKKLFKEKCPVCGNYFFPQPGGIVFFVRCNSCQAKIGDEKNG